MPLSERLPRRYDKNSKDVFAIVKHHMCDTEPCQPALLVLPGDEALRVKRFWSQVLQDAGLDPSLEPDRQKDILDLADAFALYPNYQRGVAYMRAMGGQGSRTRYPAHELPFLQSGGVQAPGLVLANVPPACQQAGYHKLAASKTNRHKDHCFFRAVSSLMNILKMYFSLKSKFNEMKNEPSNSQHHSFHEGLPVAIDSAWVEAHHEVLDSKTFRWSSQLAFEHVLEIAEGTSATWQWVFTFILFFFIFTFILFIFGLTFILVLFL